MDPQDAAPEEDRDRDLDAATPERPHAGHSQVAAGEQDYLYDFFLSYRSESFQDGWIQTALLPTLEATFMREWGRKPKIHDFRTTRQGVEIPSEVKRKLAYSKCLLPLWCAGYFQSRWCLWELEVMMRREAALGMRSDERPEGLVLPILVGDGRAFPDYTWRIHHLDVRNYVYSTPAFLGSAKFLEFQDAIRRWIPDAIRTVEMTPAWQPSWLTAEEPAPPDAAKPEDWTPLV